MKSGLGCLVVLATVLLTKPAGAQDAATLPSCDGEQMPRVVRGVVLNESGSFLPGKAIQLSGSGIERVVLTGNQGEYVFDSICPGTYAVEVLGGYYPAKTAVPVGVNDVRRNLISRPASSNSVNSLVAVTIGLFALGLLLFRHHNIVRSNRELLIAQVDNLTDRIPLESDQTKYKVESQALAARAAAVKKAFEKWSVAEWFFWSRGRELAGWMRLHEVERQVIAFLVPEERVVERAVYAEAELRQINSPSSTVLADRMRATLQQVVASGSGESDHLAAHALAHLKQQLGEGLAIIYDDGDTRFSGLMEWHNKAMFLVYLSLLGIAVLGLVFRHEELFLVGAVGGLMSRMARTLFREDVPSDYGASWTTLFLSPLLGAISAWIGIALIIWLREMNVLDDELFGRIDWHLPTDAVMIAMAFTLGFSERLFTSLLSKVEGKVVDSLNRPPAAPAPPGPLVPPAPPARGPQTPGAGGATAPPTRDDQIVAELDLTGGERVAFVGDPASATRARLVGIVGAASVVDATADTIAAKGPLDAVLVETIPDLVAMPILAGQIADALQPDGRVVFVGRTGNALFDGDATAQRGQGHAGPAVIKEAMTTTAGLTSQEPPAKLDAADPVEWMLSFFKPAPGGGDR